MEKKNLKTVIILNPVSGVGDGSKRKEEILAAMKTLKFKAEIEQTSKSISAASIAKRAIKKGYNHIIAGGGDGTVMEVVGEIVGKNVVMSVIALGTGNIFAKNLQIPLEVPDALKLAVKGRVIKMDVGQANGTFFGVNAGVGMDAEIMAETTRPMKDKFGLLAYIAVGLRKLKGRRGIYSVVVDDRREKIYRAKSVLVANMEKTAGGIKAVPGARPIDGKLSVGILKARHIPDWISILVHAISGNINKSAHFEKLTGSHIEITSLSGPKAFQCDGNTFPPAKKLKVDIFPSSLQVTIP